MKYATPQAFRQALEERLRRDHPHPRIPRLRKMIAFERLMAHLNEDWILKGGYALQLRTDLARPTQDIDLLARPKNAGDLFERFIKQLHQDMGDYFSFSVEQTASQLDLGGSVRFRVTSRVAGRVFERFHVDIGHHDVIVGPIDYLLPPQMLSFAEITADPIPCYPVTQHVAEKLHALTKPRPTENSRLKDLIDVLLLAGLDITIHADRLRAAIEAVFRVRGDVLPIHFGPTPNNWKVRYRKIFREIELPYENLEQASRAASMFIDPILADIAIGVWHPETWRWGVK